MKPMKRNQLIRGARRSLVPLFKSSISQLPSLAGHYVAFFRSWRQFRRLGGLAPADEFRLYLFDRTAHSQTGGHPYFFQDVWALQKLAALKPRQHHDVGSRLDGFVGQATSLCPVVFWDIRPPNFSLPNLEYRNGSILEMPLRDWSVLSLSCLHTIEHIGLGRYGDAIDPQGTDKAMRELARILAPGGQLFLSCPIGRERVCFNAHRILHPERAIQLLPELSLKEFSAVGDLDNGSYHFFRDAIPKDFAKADEALGLYVFVRPT
jgi:hypothetical protein